MLPDPPEIEPATFTSQTHIRLSMKATKTEIISNKYWTLRKHAYSNTLKISPSKTESFHIKILIFFSYFYSNIDCGYSLEPPRRGGSNEYPQSMFLNRNKKIMYTPVNSSFTIWKWGLRGSKLYRYVFAMKSREIFSHVSKNSLHSWLMRVNILLSGSDLGWFLRRVRFD